MVKKEDRAKMIHLPLSKKWVDCVDNDDYIVVAEHLIQVFEQKYDAENKTQGD